jgi:excisionase family DNA binding protein
MSHGILIASAEMVGERSRSNSQESAEKAGAAASCDAPSGRAIRESGMMRKAELLSDEILTRAEVAQLLRCSEPHVTALIERDGLPAFRLGKLWRFRRSEVLAWCERRTNAKSER